MPYANVRELRRYKKPRNTVQTLTRGKASSEEHVKQILRGNIRLEVSLGAPSGGSAAFHLAVLIVVTPFLHVGQDGVRVSDSYTTQYS